MRRALISVLFSALLSVQLHAEFSDLHDILKTKNIPHKYSSKKGNQDIHIAADLFKLNMESNNILGQKNVTIRQNDLFLSANTLQYIVRSDQLKLKGDVSVKKDLLSIKSSKASAKMPDLITFDDNMSFNYKEFNGQSKQAIYNIKDSAILLKKDALVTEGDRLVKGDSVVFDVKNETLRSTGRAKIKFTTE